MNKITYNATEVAEVLGVSKSYVYQLMKEKRIPVLELGKRKVIPILEFEAWVKENIVYEKKSLA